MPKGVFFCSCLLFLYTGTIKAQETDYVSSKTFHNHFYFSPIELFNHDFQLSYEHDFSGQTSVMIGGDYILYNADNQKTQGSGGEIQYRISLFQYPGKNGSLFLNEIFFAPYGRLSSENKSTTQGLYINGTPTGTTISETLLSYGGGVLMGVKVFSSSNRFCLSLYAGGGVKYVTLTGTPGVFNSSTLFDDAHTGIIPRIGFQLGVSF